jgi:hypothetical protein
MQSGSHARQVFLVQAHDNEQQLKALLARLLPADSPDWAFVHIDRKSALWRSARLEDSLARPRTTIIDNPVSVRWGHASQLTATRLLIRAAMRMQFQLAHLISGSDWPVVSPDKIAADHIGKCHIEAMPNVQSERMERIRLDARLLRVGDNEALKWYWSRGLRMLSRALPPRRTRLWGAWHKGSQWWSLPHDACRLVLCELDRAFARGQLIGSVCSDEHVIQTIVAAHFPERLAPALRSRPCGKRQHCTQWPWPQSSRRPVPNAGERPAVPNIADARPAAGRPK